MAANHLGGQHQLYQSRNALQHLQNGRLHQVAPETVASAAGRHQKGHQRRQSVARLLPDISKLRLLSWLVEASSELINCDIAIMDGVYAKLNKSQESLLFWSAGNQAAPASSSNQPQQQQQQQQQQPRPPPRPSKQPVANLSLAKMISEQKQGKRHNKSRRPAKELRLAAARNHHSLPLTNYDASSLAAVSLSPSLGHQSIASSSLSAATAPALAAAVARHSAAARRAPVMKSCDLAAGKSMRAAAATSCAHNHQSISCDGAGQPPEIDKRNPAQEEQPEADRHDRKIENQDEEAADEDEDDDGASSNAGASSTTSSSGVQGSLSSDCSSSGSFSSSASSAGSSASSSASSCSNEDHHHHQQQHLGRSARLADGCAAGAPSASNGEPAQLVSSAERLSEKIRRTVMEHNHLQNLLVNIIRQHDRLRDQLNQQRRRQMSLDAGCGRHLGQQARFAGKLPRIDLADIADALDDGCSCCCHSQRFSSASSTEQSKTLGPSATASGKKVGKRASTLPALLLSSAATSNSAGPLNVAKCCKARRFKKQQQRNTFDSSSIYSNNNNNNNTSNKTGEQEAANKNRQQVLSMLADKLCENCFETHYWLHGCGSLNSITSRSLAAEPETATSATQATANSDKAALGAADDHDHDDDKIELNNAIVAKRNATFIKLVQQETRSTISKSIELIDLIRREIKSPESIKHKQLMRCFSTSIQLLTSVGNYVVPSQDISAIIPEAGLQQQTQLFGLPSSDFDHLLMNGSYSLANWSQLNAFNQQQTSSNHPSPQQSNYHLAPVPEIPIRRQINLIHPRFLSNGNESSNSNVGAKTLAQLEAPASTTLSQINERSSKLEKPKTTITTTTVGSNRTTITKDSRQVMNIDNNNCQASQQQQQTKEVAEGPESSSGASSNNSSASSSIARGTVQQSSLTRAHTSNAILVGTGNSRHDKTSHNLSLEQYANLSRHQNEDDLILPTRPKFWQSSKFNFIKKLLHVKQQRLLRQQSKDRRIYNNKVQNKFRLVMMDLTHFNKSQQLLTTENGVNSLLTSMRNVLEFGLYLTLKLY